ncbi:MAG: transposase family protein [Candidatus Contendobacter sp.]|nr:transposase family protein [Candidatus Contendobacter sp.]
MAAPARPRPYLAQLPAPRRETRNKLHPFQNIPMIVLSAVLSGIEDGVGTQACVQQREAWLRRFLASPNDMPSHDILSPVIGRLDPVAFPKFSLKLYNNFSIKNALIFV